jgi:glucosamine--fructose-6-phosphate aminotransferase (isomerizing)
MKHGPIALISENCPSVFFVPKGEIFNKIVSSMQEIKARKGKIIAIVTAGCELPAGLADEVIRISPTATKRCCPSSPPFRCNS